MSSSKPLVAQANRMSGARSGASSREHRAKGMARHRQQHVARAAHAPARAPAPRRAAAGNGARGKVALVAAARAPWLHARAVAAPQARRPAAARELDGERGAPRAGAEHGDRRAPPVGAHGAQPAAQLVCSAVRFWFAAYSASKLTGGSRNCGKPPWVTRMRDRGARIRKQHARADAADGALDVLVREIPHHESAGLLDLDQEDGGCRPAWPRRSRSAPPRADRGQRLAAVCRSRLICGFQLPSTRGPLGAS